MKLHLCYYGNPILRKKTAPVAEITDEIRQLVRDMEETMKAHNGIGLAACQVGHAVAVCIILAPHEDTEEGWAKAPTRVFINPKLSDPSLETWTYNEGCLSIPKVRGLVTRPMSITVTAQNLDGTICTERLTGWPARICMHENDHLNGVLFIDRISDREQRLVEPLLKQIKKEFNKLM